VVRRWWANLRERCQTCSRVTLGLGVLIVVLVVGGVLLAAGAAGLAWTNTEQFCIGCHEMRDNVFAEFKGTIHDTNRSGVRAICSDCHVPREPVPMLRRKVAATFELWGHFTGKLDTKEKFEARRYEMAKSVWITMIRNDSHECRNCHKTESMSAELQSEKARARHAKAKSEGLTCVQCHFGIAHKEPDGPGPMELKIVR
jgi:cytochrome c-type protein NapC